MKKLMMSIICGVIISSAFAQNNDGNPSTFWHDPIKITNDSESLKTVKLFFSAYQNGNSGKFSTLLDENIIWTAPGDNRISGIKKNRSEVLEMLRNMAVTSAGSVKLSHIRFFATGDNTIGCSLRWQAVQPIGRILDVLNIGVFTVENGKIKTAKLFSDNISAEDIFWGQD
jgi:ketosteroid isomerase-like protein